MRPIDETPFDRLDVDQEKLETLVASLTEATRYDVALVLIPFAFAIALLSAFALDAGVAVAIVLPTLVAILVIVDVCYRNPPTEEPSP